MMHEITIRISVTPERVRLTLLFLLLTAFPRLSATQDEPQLWSYFPPPSTALKTLTVADSNPGSAAVQLARDFGDVQIGNKSFPNQDLNVRVNNSGTISTIGRKARLAVSGALRVNGCISLKNGTMGAPAPAWGGGSWTPGTFDPASYWRCVYYP